MASFQMHSEKKHFFQILFLVLIVKLVMYHVLIEDRKTLDSTDITCFE